MRARTAIPLLAALCGVIAAAPAATAQSQGVVPTELELFLEDPGPALKVFEPRLLAVTINYRYGQGGAASEPVCIELEVTAAPPWAMTTLEPERLCLRIPAGSVLAGTTVQGAAILNVTILDQGKAFEPGTVGIRGEAQAAGNLQRAEGTAERTTSPDFYSVITLAAAQDSLPAPGGRATRVALRVENLGNAPTEVRFILVHGPEFSSVTLPEPIILPSRLDEGTHTRDVRAQIRTPWNINDDGPLEIGVVTNHATKPNLVGMEPTVVVEVDGSALTPGPGLGALALAAAAARLLARNGLHR